MPTREEKSLAEYAERRADFSLLGEQVKRLLEGFIDTARIRVHSVDMRVKAEESLKEKLRRKEYNSLNDVTDLLGIRIITYFSDDVEKIRSIIEKEFQLDASLTPAVARGVVVPRNFLGPG